MAQFDHEIARVLLESTRGQNPESLVYVRVADLAHVAEAALQYAPAPAPPPQPLSTEKAEQRVAPRREREQKEGQ